MNLQDKHLENLKKWVDDGDYCFLCDNHPSSGHSEDCPLNDAVQQVRSAEPLRHCPKCNAVAGWHHEKCEYYSPLCPECQCELHLTTAGEHVCRNETCKMYR